MFVVELSVKSIGIYCICFMFRSFFLENREYKVSKFIKRVGSWLYQSCGNAVECFLIIKFFFTRKYCIPLSAAFQIIRAKILANVVR